MKHKHELEAQLTRAASNMKQARIAAERIKLASEPEPQTTGGVSPSVTSSGAPSFSQVKR